MKLSRKQQPAHRIDYIWFMPDVPAAVVTARDTFAMFQDVYSTTHPSFKPSAEVEAHSFTSFVYKQGGRDAVKWLAKSGVIAKRIVKDVLAEEAS